MTSLSELEKLDRDFYLNDALYVAKSLIGKYLIRKIDGRYAGGIIVETECYIGPFDDAAHSYQFRKTKRNDAMYEEGGIAYVYQIYGMYYCLNVVAGGKNKPEAVLIRSIEPLIGIDIMKENRKKELKNLTNGPAKLCMALNIDIESNKQNLLSDELFIAKDKEKKHFEIVETKRININYAEKYKDKLWRFIMKNNMYVSR